MLLILAVFGGALGLLATAAGVFTIWSVYAKWKEARNSGFTEVHPAEIASRHFFTWTVFDGALFVLIVLGLLFVFADLLAVFRDRAQFPPYHFGYLLCGFVFLLIGIVFMVLRLTAVLKPLGSAGAAAPDHHRKPDQADQPK